MRNEVVAYRPGDVAREVFREKLELIKALIAPGASDAELDLFSEVCRRTGLDPIQRQIYSVKRGDTRTIQTGIDGYRLIADRTGLYAGSDDPVYDVEDADHPNRATVTVWKLVEGERMPFTATTRWTEYKPPAPQDHMWLRMPFLMLAKTAEALALRKAFPQELSGIYTDAEMDQARVVDAPARSVRPAATPIAMPPRHGIMSGRRGNAGRVAAAPDAVPVRELSAFWQRAAGMGFDLADLRRTALDLWPVLDNGQGALDARKVTPAMLGALGEYVDGAVTLRYADDGTAVLEPLGGATPEAS